MTFLDCAVRLTLTLALAVTGFLKCVMADADSILSSRGSVVVGAIEFLLAAALWTPRAGLALAPAKKTAAPEGGKSGGGNVR